MGYRIIESKTVAPKNRLMVVEAPLIARHGKAGQFAILRVNQQGERIPLTLADWDADRGTVTFVIQEVGKSSALLAALQEGDEILDLVGPLGNPTHIENYGTVIAIGGGLGIAPLYPISRAFHQAGNRVTCIIGARSRDLLFWEDHLRTVCHELHICTDDGSLGFKGNVGMKLQQLLDEEKPPREGPPTSGESSEGKESSEKKSPADLVFAVGPPIMMKAVAETTRPFGIKTVVSLNPIMVDGTGMCGACRVEVGGKTYFACVDGPDFDAHQVNFDLMMQRLRTFSEMEHRSYTYYHDRCHAESAKAGMDSD